MYHLNRSYFSSAKYRSALNYSSFFLNEVFREIKVQYPRKLIVPVLRVDFLANYNIVR